MIPTSPAHQTLSHTSYPQTPLHQREDPLTALSANYTGWQTPTELLQRAWPIVREAGQDALRKADEPGDGKSPAICSLGTWQAITSSSMPSREQKEDKRMRVYT